MYCVIIVILVLYSVCLALFSSVLSINRCYFDIIHVQFMYPYYMYTCTILFTTEFIQFSKHYGYSFIDLYILNFSSINCIYYTVKHTLIIYCV